MTDDLDCYEEPCFHIGIVSIGETECQCMDCLRTWPKENDFQSDWHQFGSQEMK